MDYYVSWGTPVSASSPGEAARRALAMQRDPEAPARGRTYVLRHGARELSVEVSASGATAHVLWDSDNQEDNPDAEYTQEFWALPPEEQLRHRVSDYLSEKLVIPEIPHPEGWYAQGLDADDDTEVGFIVSVGDSSFKVTVEPAAEPDVTDE